MLNHVYTYENCLNMVDGYHIAEKLDEGLNLMNLRLMMLNPININNEVIFLTSLTFYVVTRGKWNVFPPAAVYKAPPVHPVVNRKNSILLQLAIVQLTFPLR